MARNLEVLQPGCNLRPKLLMAKLGSILTVGKLDKDKKEKARIRRTGELREESGASQQPMARTEERPKKRHSNGEAQAKKKRRIDTAEAGRPAEELEQSKRLDHAEVSGRNRVTGQPEKEKQVESIELPENHK